MSQGTLIREQRRGDKHIDTDNFNNLVGSVNGLMSGGYDMSRIDMLRSAGGRTMVITRGAKAVNTPFSGTAYVVGKKFTGLNSDSSLPWVRINVANVTAVEDAGPAPDPFGANETWREKSKQAGDIIVDRF